MLCRFNEVTVKKDVQTSLVEIRVPSPKYVTRLTRAVTAQAQAQMQDLHRPRGRDVHDVHERRLPRPLRGPDRRRGLHQGEARHELPATAAGGLDAAWGQIFVKQLIVTSKTPIDHECKVCTSTQ